MSVTSLVPCIVVLYFQLWGAHTLSPIPTCLTPCMCQRTPLINCSSSGLFKAPSHVPATATALDLSNNSLQSLFPFGSRRVRGLQHLWVGNNALESLSMCLGKGGESTKTPTEGKERCVSWAPDLQLLSAERNQLKQIPGGLCSVKALQVLHLSYNKISELGSTALAGCGHLKVVHLHNNLISTVHPQAFKDLSNLQVLDLSHNLLSVIPLPAYLSLRNLDALVGISGNRWRCDCNSKNLRRWLSFDNEQNNAAWKVVCSSPAHHAGKNLIDLEESDLTCPRHAYHTSSVLKEVTVNEGTELLLSCAMVNKETSSDIMKSHWWTPDGRVSENKQVLILSNITEQDAGLYVCVSGSQKKNVSIFHLLVRKKIHNTRLRREAQEVLDGSAGEDNINMQRNVRATTQSDLVLAVCLSVFITFIVAFVLGVLLRPFLDKLWKRIRTKRDSTSPSSTNSMPSTTQPNPYVNEGFSDTDEQVQEVRVGSRVRFGGVTEVKDSIPYYVTVEDAKLDNSSTNSIDADVSYDDTQGSESLTNNDDTYCVELEDLRFKERSIPSRSLQVSREVPLREANTNASDPETTFEYPSSESTKVIEPIPDQEDSTELEERSISPVSSNLGLPQGLESIEQSVDFPVVTIHKDKESNIDQEAPVPGFTTDPFSAREENVDDLDPDLWNDSGESFSFPDESPRSSSRVTQVAVLDFPLFDKEMSVDKQFDERSSCSSNESALNEDEQTEYTVNPEDDEESETYNDPHSEDDELTENQLFTPEVGALTDEPRLGAHFRQDTITLDPSDVKMTFTRGDSFDDKPFTVHKSSDSSNIFSIDEEEPRQYHVHPVYRTSQKTTGTLGIDRSGPHSSSEDEEQDEHAEYPRRLQIKEPEINMDYDIPAKNPNSILDINFDNSSTSTDIEEKTNSEGERKNFKRLGPSSLLFNRGKAVTDQKAVQPTSKTTHGDGGNIGGFLGSSINREIVALEDDVKPNTREESFFGTIGQSFYPLPKITKSLMFSVSDPQSPILYGSAPVMEAGCDSKMSQLKSSSEESFFGKINLTSDPVPRVKRYLQFSQSDPQLSVKSQSIPLKTEREMRNGSGLTDDERLLSATSKGDSFFGQISPSIDGVPKVKRYLQFTKSQPQPTDQSLSTALKTDRVVPMSGSKTQPVRSDSISKDDLKLISEGEGFFVQIGTSLDGVPKVKRYIQFKKSEQSSAEWPFTSKSDYSSENKCSSVSEGDSFFEKISTTLDEVPKVTRYIQFTQSESQRSAHSTSTTLMTESVTPVVNTKIKSIKPESSSENEHSPASKGESFFEQINTTIHKVPKVARYIQFTQYEAPSPDQSSPVSPRSENKLQSGKYDSEFEEELSINTKEDNFFGQIRTSLSGIPKVKRYVNFTSQPSLSAQSPTHFSEERVTPKLLPEIQSGRLDPTSENKLDPTNKGDYLFDQVGTSFVDVPKVKRYLQFKVSEPQTSSSVTPKLVKNVLPGTFDLSSEDKPSPGTKGGFFFGQINTSPDGVPKVKRYIQFTPSEHQLSELDPQTQSRASDSLSKDKLNLSNTRDDFFGRIGTSLNEVPKVKGYIHFTKFDPQLLTQTQSTRSSHAEIITPVLVTKTQSDPSSEDMLSPTYEGDHFFGQVNASFDGVPKVKRYIEFIQHEPHSPSQCTPSVETEPIIKSGTDGVKTDVEKHSFFGQIDASFDRIPKVKKHIAFTQSEFQPLPKTESKRISSSHEDVKPTNKDNVLGKIDTSLEIPKLKRYIQFTHSSASSSDNEENPSSKDNFFEGMYLPFDNLPKVKRSLQFTQSEPKLANQLLSPSLSKESVRAELVTKGELTSTRPPEKDAKPNNQDNLFELLDISLDGVPKVKSYIQFSQTPNPSSKINSHRDNIPADTNPASGEENFFANIDASVKGIPQLKQSLKFTYCNRSDQLLSSNTERVAESGHIAEEKFSTATKVDLPVLQTGTSLETVPKIKRYIQFTQSEPHSSASLSDNEEKAGSNKDHFFERMYLPLDNLPKVNRSIQFTQSDPKLANRLQSPSLNKERVTAELVTKGELTHSSYSPVKETKTSNHDNFWQMDISVDGVPKVRRYIQFTQSELQTISPCHSSDNTTDTVAKLLSVADQKGNGDKFFRQINASFDHLPKVKRYVHFTQAEPYPLEMIPVLTAKVERKRSFSFDDKVQFTTKSEDFFGQIGAYLHLEGVPKVSRYLQFSSKPHSQTLISKISNKRVDLRDSEINVKMGEGDDFFRHTGESFDTFQRPKRSLVFKTSDLQEENKLETISSVQVSSPMKMAPETSRLLSRPKRTLFFSKSDPYGQPELSTPESETISSERFSSLGASQTVGTENKDFSFYNVPMYTRSHPFSTSEGVSASMNDTDQTPSPRGSQRAGLSFQDVNQTVKETPTNSPGHDEAREYLRDSSQARQRHERRRLLFEQKRRAMDGFSLTSHSLSSQESDNQNLSDHFEDSIPRYSGHPLRSVSPANTADHTDANALGSENLTAKRISSLKYKSALYPGSYKYRSDV